MLTRPAGLRVGQHLCQPHSFCTKGGLHHLSNLGHCTGLDYGLDYGIMVYPVAECIARIFNVMSLHASVPCTDSGAAALDLK